eukprot:TRINITY_DN5907_c0_g1_i3.p1 TRINITY_DN5907_c0_g1~~TRINITY_DN5907_c0_g1_i3.p1  ORF type:complete len:244 (+),score=37.40 TRINITY_DN5907_c0_g1_i3:79-732(+)
MGAASAGGAASTPRAGGRRRNLLLLHLAWLMAAVASWEHRGVRDNCCCSAPLFLYQVQLSEVPRSFAALRSGSRVGVPTPSSATRRLSASNAVSMRGKLSDAEKKEKEPLPEAPPGGALLHVEYCEFCDYLPQYNILRKAIEQRFGEKVIVIANQEEVLMELNKEKEYRPCSFEIVDMASKKLLFTKMGSGLHITEKQLWIDKFLDEVEKICEKAKA